MLRLRKGTLCPRLRESALFPRLREVGPDYVEINVGPLTLGWKTKENENS